MKSIEQSAACAAVRTVAIKLQTHTWPHTEWRQSNTSY
eukprot:COSAG03_NODE_16941_length_388_cov_0.532872_1_plen_37_part_01